MLDTSNYLRNCDTVFFSSKKNVVVRRGTSDDITACRDLVRMVVLAATASSQGHGTEDRGFLLTELDETEAGGIIRHGTLLVCVSSEHIVGFITVFKKGSLPYNQLLEGAAKHIHWQDPGVPHRKDIVFLDRTVVHPKYRDKGTAMHLFLEFLRQFPESDIVTATIEQPFSNRRSISLLNKLKFQRVGEFSPGLYRGIEGYSAGIYLRESSVRRRKAPEAP